MRLIKLMYLYACVCTFIQGHIVAVWEYAYMVHRVLFDFHFYSNCVSTENGGLIVACTHCGL